MGVIRYKTKVENFSYWLILFGRSSRSKNDCSHSNSFYIIFCPILAPIPNFIQIGWKTQKLKFPTIGRFWSVGPVGQKMVVGIRNSFYVIFGTLLAPTPNFIQIGRKTQKLKIFAIGRFWLVGLVGRKIVAATSNIRFLFRGLPMTSVPNLNQIGWKLTKLAHREIFSQK